MAPSDACSGAPASTTQPTPTREQLIAGQMDSFFGTPSPTVKKPKPAASKKSSRTQDHMDRNLYSHGREPSQGTLAPPAYEAPAHLAPTSMPSTMARYLFLYGFLFPPFWLIGACIILSPLSSEPPAALQALPKDVEAGYASPAYEKAEHGLIRRTELVWAKRCLAAAITFISIIVIVIVVVRVVVAHH